jgi:DNA-binding CsgD family transcriptional regulator
MWWLAMVLLPTSPFLAYLGSNRVLTGIMLALVVVPYIFTAIFSDRLSSNQSIKNVSWLTLVIATFALFLENPILRALCFSFVLAGIDLVWIPSRYSIYAKKYPLRHLGFRFLFAGAGFAVLVLVDNPALTEVVYLCLPFISIFLFLICNYLQPNKIEFASKAQSKERMSYFVHNPIFLFVKTFTAGLGTGCLLAAGLNNNEYLLCFAVAMLTIGILLSIWSNYLSNFRGHNWLICVLAFTMPLLILAPHSRGIALVIIGTIWVCGGRLQQVLNIDNGLDSSRFEMDKIEIYLVHGWDHIAGLFGSLSGLFIGYIMLVLDFEYSVTLKVFAFSLFLFIFVISIAYSYRKAISSYEDIIYDEHPNLRIESDIDKGVWKRKTQTIVKKKNLSTRQAEVLKYLAHGRNADFISKELFISYNTAKAHIYTIYRKLSVHSQQELIDLVEHANPTPGDLTKKE